MADLAGILALDTARRSGWAFARVGEPPVWGSIVTAPRSSEFGLQFFTFFKWLDEKITEFQPAVVGYMNPIQTPHDVSIHLQRRWGLTAIVCTAVERRRRLDMPGIACRFSEDATVYKFVTGRGRGYANSAAKKAAMIAVCKRLGWDVNNDDDAADALGLLVYQEAKLYHVQREGVAGPLFRAA